MTGPNSAPDSELVVVTETDYFTVYPSALETFTMDLSTLATLTVASSTMATSTSLVSSQMTTYSFASVAPSSSLLPSSAQPSTTTISALPVSTAGPQQQAKSSPWKNNMASLSLTAIILVIILLLSLMVYAIYQRIRGKCHKCDGNEKQLAKYRNGELKHISPAMVKSREQSQATTVRATADIDAELGLIPTSSEQRESHRQAALAKLNGPPPPAKLSIWDRAKGAAKSKGTGKGIELQSLEPYQERTVGGPVYAETDVESVRHSPLPKAPLPVQVQDSRSDSYLGFAYSPPSPSIYSRPGASVVGPPQEPYVPSGQHHHGSSDDQHPTTYSTYLETTWRPRNDQHLHEQAAAMRDDNSLVSSALNINDPRHRVRYEGAQRTMARGSCTDSDLQHALNDVNAVEKQMRKKRRSRAYGGLPHPEDFDEVDIVEER